MANYLEYTAAIDIDGRVIASAIVLVEVGKSSSVNLSINSRQVAGVEFTDEGPAFIGWFTPDTGDWIELSPL